MKENLVFIHGWPDDSSVWSKQIEHFKGQYNCVPLTLPGFGDQEDQKDFPELIDFLVQEISKLQTPVTLVAHDWGAYLAYLVEQKNPTLIKAIVGLDVGGHVVPRNIQELVFMPSYQIWLASAWLMRKSLPKVANRMSQMFASIAEAPHSGKVEARKNYIYYYVLKTLLNPKSHKNLLINYKPQCPILFIYGEKKPFMFHSKKWEKQVSEVHSIPGSGHWFMIEQPEFTNSIIEKWLKR